MFSGLETIDILIVDEAGQATPAVACAAFAKSRRALVVGDTDQIEPIWTLPEDVDRPNLEASRLLSSERPYGWWERQGRCAARGNLMRLAQDACNYHSMRELSLARGLYLTEHRRCRPQIIDFCNKLVYNGVLEPLREDTSPLDLPAMGGINVAGISRRHQGSRINDNEARSIAEWLIGSTAGILDAYRRRSATGTAPAIRDHVAVVTPFKAQARLIQEYLAGTECADIVVGTVHSLQGAEIDVVLFSSVYGENDDSGTKFYDRSHHMLNVAVSRAKDHFIVFASMAVFGRVQGTPSWLLRGMLEPVEQK